jgi:hypothetical protein
MRHSQSPRNLPAVTPGAPGYQNESQRTLHANESARGNLDRDIIRGYVTKKMAPQFNRNEKAAKTPNLLLSPREELTLGMSRLINDETLQQNLGQMNRKNPLKVTSDNILTNP